MQLNSASNSLRKWDYNAVEDTVTRSSWRAVNGGLVGCVNTYGPARLTDSRGDSVLPTR